ncbi:hypothetical protein [Microbispora bryophytorum]|uniref:hypothetical protein n=1 Tax=Microbispora bryophytorum TaxID=1460882 RepID=UPI0033C2E807
MRSAADHDSALPAVTPPRDTGGATPSAVPSAVPYAVPYVVGGDPPSDGGRSSTMP